jgi:hypothetical protein
VLFTKAEIEEGLLALADELDTSGVATTICVVGGSAIILHVDRQVLTNDVDALYSSSPEFESAVRKVSEAKRWPETWLNDAVKMWASHYDTDADWEVRIIQGNVTVQVAKPALLLAMKLLAGRGLRDLTDIDLLLEACAITSLDEATALFDKYYPTESIAPRALRQLQDRFSQSSQP